jgi:TRAP-type mannitol/chloroaromatic compound transport system permease small subunit
MPNVLQNIEKTACMVDRLNERIGRAVCWLALGMVLVQVAVVLMRYVFGQGSVMMQEAIIDMHAALFMLGAGYTLRHDGHVRCDLFYRDLSPSRRAWVDLLGVVLFLLPMCMVIFWVAMPYVINAWSILEGSPEGSLGLPGVFLLKTLIPIFATLLGLQGLALAGHAVAFLGDRPPLRGAGC